MSTPLFLLGFHRGGTTFVQRLLNCHPDVTIWGENGGFLTGLRRSFDGERHPVDRRAFAEFSTFADRVVSWASPVDTNGFGRAVAAFVEGVYATATVWGFKEIRHNDFDDIAFLKALFPTARLLLLRRQARDILLSQLYAVWSDAPPDAVGVWVEDFVASVRSTVDAFRRAAERWPGEAFVVAYEDIRDVPSALALFDRIGIPSDNVDRALVERVLGAKVNSSFVDVGRTVPPELRDEVLAIYDQLASGVRG